MPYLLYYLSAPSLGVLKTRMSGICRIQYKEYVVRESSVSTIGWYPQMVGMYFHNSLREWHVHEELSK